MKWRSTLPPSAKVVDLYRLQMARSSFKSGCSGPVAGTSIGVDGKCVESSLLLLWTQLYLYWCSCRRDGSSSGGSKMQVVCCCGDQRSPWGVDTVDVEGK